jgi:hypothetical protein
LRLLGCSYWVQLFAAVESPRKRYSDSVAPSEAEAPAVALALYCETVQALLLQQQQQQEMVGSQSSSPAAATAGATVAAACVHQQTLVLHQQMLLVLLPWAAAVKPGTVNWRFCLNNAMDACAAVLNVLPTTPNSLSPAQDVLMQQQAGQPQLEPKMHDIRSGSSGTQPAGLQQPLGSREGCAAPDQPTEAQVQVQDSSSCVGGNSSSSKVAGLEHPPTPLLARCSAVPAPELLAELVRMFAVACRTFVAGAQHAHSSTEEPVSGMPGARCGASRSSSGGGGRSGNSSGSTAAPTPESFLLPCDPDPLPLFFRRWSAITSLATQLMVVSSCEPLGSRALQTWPHLCSCTYRVKRVVQIC